MSEEALPSTGTCQGCGKTFPISELIWFDSLGGYEKDGYYCKDCLPVIEESDDSQDWLDEIELDEDEDP